MPVLLYIYSFNYEQTVLLEMTMRPDNCHYFLFEKLVEILLRKVGLNLSLLLISPLSID
jgi:hypothetical protein